jgi:hypothetical protein
MDEGRPAKVGRLFFYSSPDTWALPSRGSGSQAPDLATFPPAAAPVACGEAAADYI